MNRVVPGRREAGGENGVSRPSKRGEISDFVLSRLAIAILPLGERAGSEITRNDRAPSVFIHVGARAIDISPRVCPISKPCYAGRRAAASLILARPPARPRRSHHLPVRQAVANGARCNGLADGRGATLNAPPGLCRIADVVPAVTGAARGVRALSPSFSPSRRPFLPSRLSLHPRSPPVQATDFLNL